MLAGRSRRQPGRRHDQLRPRRRRPPRGGPTLGQRGRLGSPLRGRSDLERQPNGSLVHEVSGLAPGRALDVGAGEGGDAVWLAERGLDRDRERHLGSVPCDRVAAEADAGTFASSASTPTPTHPTPFEAGALRPRVRAATPRSRAPPTVAASTTCSNAVAPGGTPARGEPRPRTHARADRHPAAQPAFDPDAYVRVDDIAAALVGAPDWTIEVHETRPRPAGAASAAHHVDDVVLRARRHPS